MSECYALKDSQCTPRPVIDFGTITRMTEQTTSRSSAPLNRAARTPARPVAAEAVPAQTRPVCAMPNCMRTPVPSAADGANGVARYCGDPEHNPAAAWKARQELKSKLTGAPIDERPVPQSDTPGEKSWLTQPFPTVPPPFARQSFTEDDVNPWLLTPEEYEAMKERVRKAKNGKGPQGGIFVPTVLNGDAVSMPGNQGGSNWGTTAADPQRGLVFVTNVNQVALLRLNDVKDPPAGQGRVSSTPVGGRTAW